MRVRISGAWKEVSGGRVRVAGAWKNLVRVRGYIGGAWKDIATFVPPLSLGILPSPVRGDRNAAGTVTTPAATATPVGGVSPFTYAWARVGAGAAAANTPSSASTTFTRFVGSGDDVEEIFRCTATDARGATATADVVARFTSTGLDFPDA